MDFVCYDLDGVSAWYYEAESKSYARKKPDGSQDTAGGPRIIAKLAGRDVPNPDKLWLTRCNLVGVGTASMEAAKLKPTPIVYSLFSHWQGVKNA